MKQVKEMLVSKPLVVFQTFLEQVSSKLILA